MINSHTGRRIGFHTGKEAMQKYKYDTSSTHKKASKNTDVGYVVINMLEIQ